MQDRPAYNISLYGSAWKVHHIAVNIFKVYNIWLPISSCYTTNPNPNRTIINFALCNYVSCYDDVTQLNKWTSTVPHNSSRAPRILIQHPFVYNRNIFSSDADIVHLTNARIIIINMWCNVRRQWLFIGAGVVIQ